MPVRILALAAAYLLLGKLALLLAIPPGYATAVWPAAGVALVALIVGGPRLAPGVWLGSFLVNVSAASADAVAIAAIVAMGATVQAAAGAALVRRRVPWPNRFEDPRHILALLLRGGAVACTISATVGIGMLYLTGELPGRELAFSWLTWWVGDTVGCVLVAPILLLLAHRPRPPLRRLLAVAVPLVIGFALVTVLYVVVSGWERRREHDAFVRRAALVVDAIDRELRDHQAPAIAVERALASPAGAGMELSLRDAGAPGAPLIHGRDPGTPPWWRDTLLVGARTWELRLWPEPGAPETARTWVSWTVLATGLILVALLGVLTLTTTGRIAEIERAVRTQQLLLENLEQIIVERTRHLDAAVREREVLLREIHHRVKNNLQVISSLLGMQSHHVADPTVRAVLEESRSRVQAIALVHENLYQAQDLAEIGFGGYVRGLTAHLIATYGGAGRGIAVRVDAGDVHVSVTHAIPCGLIVSELVTNALKHAFPGDRGGVITIALADEPEDQLCLRVADDGVGLAADLDLRNLSSMGMDLVFAFAEQLQATVEVTRSPGTGFTIRFPR